MKYASIICFAIASLLAAYIFVADQSRLSAVVIVLVGCGLALLLTNLYTNRSKPSQEDSSDLVSFGKAMVTVQIIIVLGLFLGMTVFGWNVRFTYAIISSGVVGGLFGILTIISLLEKPQVRSDLSAQSTSKSDATI